MKYSAPVDNLLTYGECRSFSEWPAYTDLGISEKDIPSLIEMVTDRELLFAPSDSKEVWAPAHAWRALGQLRAVEAIEPLIGLFDELEDDDWAGEELQEVMGMLGVQAIPPLKEFLLDRSKKEFARAAAAGGLEKIGNNHREARTDCIAALSDLLSRCEGDCHTLNGLVIASLLDLNAVEALEVIRKAFEEGCVDCSVAGDLEDVEIEFGVRDNRETPRPHYGLPEELQKQFRDVFKGIDDDVGEQSPRPQSWPQPAVSSKIGRNEPCPCGSGKKYKKCCLQ